jgi:Family of unknown function (DUF6262)
MRPDVLAAVAQRHALTRAKVIRALRELDRAGTLVAFASVATMAGISRSWLYAQPDLRGRIQELRSTAAPSGPALPARQRASDPSLRARLAVALERNRQLAEENTRLRRQLAVPFGSYRRSRSASSSSSSAEVTEAPLARRAKSSARSARLPVAQITTPASASASMLLLAVRNPWARAWVMRTASVS